MSWAPGGHQLAFIEHQYTASAFSSGDLFSLKTHDLITGKSQTILSDQRIGSRALCWAPEEAIMVEVLIEEMSKTN